MPISPSHGGVRLELNAYLLRVGVDPVRALNENAARIAELFRQPSRGEPFTALDIRDVEGANDSVVAAIMTRPTNPPLWQEFVGDSLGMPELGALGLSSMGAVIFTTATDPVTGETRWLAWCFGTGARSLRKQSVDPRFGLITVLNAITNIAGGDQVSHQSSGRLRRLQHRTPAPYTQQTDHRAARDLPIHAFRIHRLIDLINAAGGSATDGPLFGALFGGKSLRFRQEVMDFDDLRQLGADAMSVFRLKRYQTDYGWIDNYILVEDRQTITELEKLLWQTLMGDPNSVDVLLPDDALSVGDDVAIEYVLLPSERSSSSSRLVLTSDVLAKFLASSGHEGMRQKLRFLDTRRSELVACPIIDCLAADLTLAGKRYVVCDGDFYEVDVEFLDRINEEVLRLELGTITFPPYAGHVEASWIKTAAAQDGTMVCLDRCLIRLPGETPIEACDLVTTSGALVHAKRLGHASKVTYVFVQALRSSELLAAEPEARRQLQEHVKAECSPATAEAVLTSLQTLGGRPADNEVVIALLGDWHNRDLTSLSLLVKLGLLETVRQLRLIGYRPTVARVGLASRS